MSRYKILIADDDQDLVQTLKGLLEFNGFEILEAYEGVRVVEAAHKKNPDLIILDWKMPAGGGQTVLQSLRAKPETKEIPVIVLTGVDKPDMEATIQQAGAQDFVLKPYEDKALLGKIRALLPSST